MTVRRDGRGRRGRREEGFRKARTDKGGRDGDYKGAQKTQKFRRGGRAKAFGKGTRRESTGPPRCDVMRWKTLRSEGRGGRATASAAVRRGKKGKERVRLRNEGRLFGVRRERPFGRRAGRQRASGAGGGERLTSPRSGAARREPSGEAMPLRIRLHPIRMPERSPSEQAAPACCRGGARGPREPVRRGAREGDKGGQKGVGGKKASCDADERERGSRGKTADGASWARDGKSRKGGKGRQKRARRGEQNVLWGGGSPASKGGRAATPSNRDRSPKAKSGGRRRKPAGQATTNRFDDRGGLHGELSMLPPYLSPLLQQPFPFGSLSA